MSHPNIEHNFLVPLAPQQNGVIERRNRELIEIARIMFCEHDFPKYFLSEDINISCYIINRVIIRLILKKTLYELFKGEKRPNISYFHLNECKCFVFNNGKDNLEKFDAKLDEAIVFCYSSTFKAFTLQ